MKVKTVWQSLIETEAGRLLHTAHGMVNGFYHVNNFIVLPYLPKIATANVVVFPDLKYTSIPRFWNEAKKINDDDLPLDVPQKLRASVENLLRKEDYKLPDFTNLKRRWSLAQDQILEAIYNIIPKKRGIVKKVTINYSNFGTSCSFNLISPEGEVVIELRSDENIAAIAEAIITSITRRDIFGKLDGIWEDSEIITDWLITESALSKIIEKYDKTPFLPTMKGVRIKQQAKILQESNEYYKKLGLPSSQKLFGLNGLIPEIDKKPVENLTPTEKAILKLLIQKAGGVVTFDEFGNELFGQDGDFSLYAISKNIERLRNKLEENGISGSYIQTLRGKGYVLKN